MKAKELMQFDWVCLEDDPTPRQVDFIRTGEVGLYYNRIATPPNIKPIPLTPEILEKNGFKLKEKGVLYTEYVSGDEHSIIEFGFYKESIHDIDTVLNCELGFVGGLDRIHHCHVKYVHELQHALRLCGIEKEIVL